MSYQNFLPEGFASLKTTKNYADPAKLAEGEHKFRIVSRPIAGWKDWKDNKPLRFRPENKPKSPIDPTKEIKSFWAMYVWDYQKEGLYVMEITQTSIQRALQDLAMNEDWGDLTCFDIKIKKTGSKKDTVYSVFPIPHKPLGDNIKQALALTPVRLEALYEGKDPWSDLTPQEASFDGLSDQQSAIIDGLLLKIGDKSFQKELEEHMHVTSIHNIAARDYDRAVRALEERIKSREKKEKTNDQRRMATVA